MINYHRSKNYCLLALTLILSDQGSKNFVIWYLESQASNKVTLLPFLDAVYAWNYGISFGIFTEYQENSNAVFLILTPIIISYLIYTLYKQQNIISEIGLLCIISGAIGNLLDRIFFGSVFDFIYFHYDKFSFPAFNFADMFISMGAAIIAHKYFCNKQEHS